MLEGSPSRTALRVAVLRALHQTVDAPPLFVDPLAERILGASRDMLDAERAAETGSRRLRATLAARAVVAEEAVAAAIARGTRQHVLLGAGLDTFAHRHAHAGLSVFEVDHPATQAWKRGLLREADIGESPGVRFVAADLARDDIPAVLAAAGLDGARPTIFVMLGVTPYLPEAVLLRLLGSLAASCASGSEIVLDYTEPWDRASNAVRSQYEAAAARVAAVGEPWLTLLPSVALAQALRGMGFVDIVDTDATALDARFCAGRPDGFRVAPLVHLVQARL